jgi:hypothetical protein
MGSDRVLTVNDYYDGPRLGVAELHGVPHIYEAEFDHSTEEYGDTYYLSPIGSDLLELVLEDWEIWLRWERAYKRGEASIDSHPALPEESNRHKVLKHAIGDRLASDPGNRVYYRAKFSADGNFVDWQAP